MSVLNGLKSMFVGADEETEIEETYTANETVSSSRDARNREVKIAATTTLQIVLARPTDFSEVKSIGDDLNDQKTVLLNLETVKGEDAKRILDTGAPESEKISPAKVKAERTLYKQ